MDLKISLRIIGKKLGQLGVLAEKSYADVDFLPNIGDILQEGIAKNGCLEVTGKFIDYEMDECYIEVKSIQDDTHTLDEVINILCKPHDWNVNR